MPGQPGVPQEAQLIYQTTVTEAQTATLGHTQPAPPTTLELRYQQRRHLTRSGTEHDPDSGPKRPWFQSLHWWGRGGLSRAGPLTLGRRRPDARLLQMLHPGIEGSVGLGCL
jgi:hypothetical protein